MAKACEPADPSRGHSGRGGLPGGADDLRGRLPAHGRAAGQRRVRPRGGRVLCLGRTQPPALRAAGHATPGWRARRRL